PAERLARPTVERAGNSGEVGGAVSREIGPFREVPPQQAVRVLVRAALPGAVRVAEVDLKSGVDPQLRVLGHLRSLVPGQRAAQLLGRVVIAVAIASLTASAPWPATAGPFFTLGPWALIG